MSDQQRCRGGAVPVIANRSGAIRSPGTSVTRSIHAATTRLSTVDTNTADRTATIIYGTPGHGTRTLRVITDTWAWGTGRATDT